MSTLITKNAQIGTSGTPADNFTIFQPATPDGTLRIGNGNTGITTGLVTLNSAGNLGIGTSSPTSRVTVGSGTFNAAASGTTGLYTAASGANAGYLTVITDGIDVSTRAGAGRLILDAPGNLGLGVTPSAWNSYRALQIGPGTSLAGWATDAGTDLSSNAFFQNQWNYIASARALRYQMTTTGEHRWFTAPSGTAGDAISFTQALTLDAGGDLNVGGTNPGGWRLRVDKNNAQAMLLTNNVGNGVRINMADQSWQAEIEQNAGNLLFKTGGTTERARIDSSGTLLIGRTSAVSNTTRLGLDATDSIAGFVSETGPTTSVTHGRFYNGNGNVGTISTSGSATTYATSSDYRLKNTIAPMTGALAKVALLKPCTYKWNADGSDGEGFIAHELAEVVPQCVTGEKDAVDAEGKPQYQGIDTSFLVATLTAAIQEQQALIQTLTARVAALESN
jgi:hypothetical protein